MILRAHWQISVGNHEYHLTSLMNAHCCITGDSTGPVLHVHPEFRPDWYDQSHISLNRSSWLEHDVDAGDLVPCLPVYPESFFTTPGAFFGGNEMQTRQGLETFFPRMNANVGVHMALSERDHDKGVEEWKQEELQISSVENKLVYSLPYENRVALVEPFPEASKLHSSNTTDGSISSQTPVMPEVHLEVERVALPSYILEDNNDLAPSSALRRK